MFNSWKTAALLLALYRVLSSKCSIRNLFNRSIALTSSRFRFTRSVYVQVILWDKISGLRLFFNSWMSTMSQRLISAVQTFCFQEVANQKKGEGRRWSQAEDGLMGFTTDSIKIDMAIWPVEVLFFFLSIELKVFSVVMLGAKYSRWRGFTEFSQRFISLVVVSLSCVSVRG